MPDAKGPTEMFRLKLDEWMVEMVTPTPPPDAPAAPEPAAPPAFGPPPSFGAAPSFGGAPSFGAAPAFGPPPAAVPPPAPPAPALASLDEDDLAAELAEALEPPPAPGKK
jgi:hypothetical protein